MENEHNEIEHTKQEATRREQGVPEPEAQKEKQEAMAGSRRIRFVRWFFVAAVVIVAIVLWVTILHPLWDTITYWDGGDFAGRPVYRGDDLRISKTLHNELEECGLGDGDIEEIDRLPDGITIITHLSGGQTSASFVIRKEEITAGIYEVTCSRRASPQ